MADETCEVCGREFYNPMAAAHKSRHMNSHKREEVNESVDTSAGAEGPPLAPGADAEGGLRHVEHDGETPTRETKPGRPTKAPKERTNLRELFGRKPNKEKEGQPKTTERKPRLSFRRQSTAPLFEFVWGQAGQGLMMTGADVPVGRVLTLQAPMVGDVLDEAIKGTAVDKLIQPFVRQGDRAKLIAAVVLPPLCVGLIERNPELQEPLAPVLRAVMMPMLVELAASLKKAKAQEEKMVEALADLGDLFPQELISEAKKRGQSPVDLIIESFFAPAPQPSHNGSTPAPQPSHNGSTPAAEPAVA